MRELLRSANGRAMSRPEISCEPCLPDTSARPAFRGPWTERGTRTGAEDSFASASATRSITSTSFGQSSEVFGRASAGMDVSLASKASMISLAPVRGRPRRVFSPVNVTGAWLSWAITGIIMRVRRPDSPTFRVMVSEAEPSWPERLVRQPAEAPIPVIVTRLPSTST